MGLEIFPFVDRQFVTGCANDRLKQTVCRGIIELARGYGVRVVAEGIETRADLVAANEMGFDLIQGYLFGKPTALKKFARSALIHPVLAPKRHGSAPRSVAAELGLRQIDIADRPDQPSRLICSSVTTRSTFSVLLLIR